MEIYRLPDRCEALLLTGALIASLALLAHSNRPLHASRLAAVQEPQVQLVVQSAQDVAPSASMPQALDPAFRHRQLADTISRRYPAASAQALNLVQFAEQAALLRGLDPVLLLAIMAVESGYNHMAVSRAGAKGLMQIIPEFHPEKFEEPGRVFDPETNISAGALIVKEYLAQTGSLEAALQRYAGASADPQFIYANRVFDEFQHLKLALERRS